MGSRFGGGGTSCDAAEVLREKSVSIGFGGKANEFPRMFKLTDVDLLGMGGMGNPDVAVVDEGSRNRNPG